LQTEFETNKESIFIFRYLAILVEGLDREVKMLKAKKELKNQDKCSNCDPGPVYQKQLSQPAHCASCNGDVRLNISSNLVKSSSLNNIVDTVNKNGETIQNLDNYNKLDNDFLDFNVFSAKDKESKQISRAKSTEALNASSSKNSKTSPKIKKLTKKYDNKKKYSPQVSRKKGGQTSKKSDSNLTIHSSQSSPILRLGLYDFPTLHQTYRKDIEAFLNLTT